MPRLRGFEESGYDPLPLAKRAGDQAALRQGIKRGYLELCVWSAPATKLVHDVEEFVL